MTRRTWRGWKQLAAGKWPRFASREEVLLMSDEEWQEYATWLRAAILHGNPNASKGSAR